MKIKNILICLAILALAACTGLQNLETPSVTLSNISPAAESTIFEQRYDLTLRIQNPNNVDLPLSGLSYTVTFNDQEFARGVSNAHATIPALGEKLVHVTVTSGPLDWIRQVNRLQADPDLSPSYSVSGTLYLQSLSGGSQLPFSKAGKFVPGE